MLRAGLPLLLRHWPPLARRLLRHEPLAETAGYDDRGLTVVKEDSAPSFLGDGDVERFQFSDLGVWEPVVRRKIDVVDAASSCLCRVKHAARTSPDLVSEELTALWMEPPHE